jgi:putative salt-induced outer membrane protein YdiY
MGKLTRWILSLTLLCLPVRASVTDPGDSGPLSPNSVSLGWKASGSVGLSAATGNTEKRAMNMVFDAELRRENDRFTVGLLWRYTDQQNVTTGETDLTERKSSLKGKYDQFVSEHTYWLLNVGVDSDELADLDRRTTVGIGLGFQFEEGEVWTASVEAGFGWFQEDFGEAEDQEYMTLRLAAKWEREGRGPWALSQSAEVFPSVEDSDDVYSKVDSRLRLDLNDNLYAQLQWVVDWDNTPAASQERLDQTWLFTVGWGL